MRLPVYKDSFFANQRRPDGMRVKVEQEGDVVACDLRLEDRFSSPVGPIYDGLLFGVLDMLIWYVIMVRTGKVCMTRTIDMDFLEPVMAGSDYRAVASLEGVTGRDIRTLAWIEDKAGRRCLVLKALFRESRRGSIEDVLKNLDFSETTQEIRDLFMSFASRARPH